MFVEKGKMGRDDDPVSAYSGVFCDSSEAVQFLDRRIFVNVEVFCQTKKKLQWMKLRLVLKSDSAHAGNWDGKIFCQGSGEVKTVKGFQFLINGPGIGCIYEGVFLLKTAGSLPVFLHISPHLF